MTTIVICFDGMAPEYLEAARTPTFDRLGREGRWVTANGQMPSVTNVNNVSILTGLIPADHGINANFTLGPNREEIYLESPDLIRAPLVLQRAAEAGERVRVALAELGERYAGTTSVVVGHGLSMRTGMTLLLGLDLAHSALLTGMWNCSWTVLEHVGRWRLQSYNNAT